jgi:hypothetical protein
MDLGASDEFEFESFDLDRVSFDQFKINVHDQLRMGEWEIFANRLLIGLVFDVLGERLIVLVVYLLDMC